MNAKIKIRPAESADIPVMAQLIADNFDHAMPEHSPAVREQCKKLCAAEALAGQLAWKKVFVILRDGAIAGTGALADFGTPELPKWSISNFFIRRDWHGTGLGRQLLHFLSEQALKFGAVELHVPSSRTGMAFYREAGFVRDEVQPEEDAKLEITWHTRKLSDQLSALLGAGRFAVWQRARQEIEARYSLAPVWAPGGKNWDIECKYRQGGKTLCALYAKENRAGLLVIFGMAEREKFEAERQKYSESVRKSYDDATVYHDGKWVMFDLNDAQKLPELLQLLAIKRKPR